MAEEFEIELGLEGEATVYCTHNRPKGRCTRCAELDASNAEDYFKQLNDRMEGKS